jgi:hypothetical protein
MLRREDEDLFGKKAGLGAGDDGAEVGAEGDERKSEEEVPTGGQTTPLSPLPLLSKKGANSLAPLVSQSRDENEALSLSHICIHKRAPAPSPSHRARSQIPAFDSQLKSRSMCILCMVCP